MTSNGGLNLKATVTLEKKSNMTFHSPKPKDFYENLNKNLN